MIGRLSSLSMAILDFLERDSLYESISITFLNVAG